MRGRRSIFREIVILLAGAAVLARGRVRRPAAAVHAVPGVTGTAENLDKSLGSFVRSQVLASNTVVEDPKVKAAFKVIPGRLRDALPGRRIDFEVIVLQSREINAFTLPGDTICVDTGLIRELRSADQMAGVLGHELSHAVNKDPLTLLVRRLGVAALLGVISGGQAEQSSPTRPRRSSMSTTAGRRRIGRTRFPSSCSPGRESLRTCSATPWSASRMRTRRKPGC